MPHTPHNPPESFLTPYKNIHEERVAKYYGMVSWFDDTIGKIVSHIEQQGLRERTLIIYLADNGYSLTSDVLNDDTHRGKNSAYEDGIRTPVIFNWPNQWPTAVRTDLVSSIDIFPTLMELLQQPLPDVLPGVSLLANLYDGNSLARQAVAGESYIDRGEERFDNVRAFRWLRFREANNSNWKLIDIGNGQHELYHLDTDDAEQYNLATDASQAARLEQALAQLDRLLHTEAMP